MRKIFVLCVVALMAVASCTSDKDKVMQTITAGIESLDRQLPISFALGSMTDARVDGSQIVFSVNLNKTYSSMLADWDAFDPEMGAVGFVKSMYDSGLFSYEDFRVSEISLKCRYCDEHGRLMHELVVSNDELLKAYKKIEGSQEGMPLYDKEYYMNKIVNDTKPMLPYDCGNGLIFTDVRTAADNIVMEYEMSDDLTMWVDFTPELVQEQRGLLVAELKNLASSDHIMYSDMAKHGIVFRYDYVNEAGDLLMCIEVPASEIVQ